eukprot:354695-Chlamydomonas_euryale.AAC.8
MRQSAHVCYYLQVLVFKRVPVGRAGVGHGANTKEGRGSHECAITSRPTPTSASTFSLCTPSNTPTAKNKRGLTCTCAAGAAGRAAWHRTPSARRDCPPPRGGA